MTKYSGLTVQQAALCAGSLDLLVVRIMIS